MKALWQPGTDRAKQSLQRWGYQQVKKNRASKQKQRSEEEFLKTCPGHGKKCSGKIINQLKKLGASADWEKKRFTMDRRMFQSGAGSIYPSVQQRILIYKGSVSSTGVSNSRPLSDAEVKNMARDQDGFFWHINYPVVGEEGKFE